MAWMTQRLGAAGHGAKRRRPGPVKLYYAARTHGQAKQVMRELNRTEYASSLGVSAVILGGRKRLCAMEPVRDCNQVDAACRTLVGVARNAAANGLPMAPPPSGGYDPKKYDCSVGCKYYHGERIEKAKAQAWQSPRCLDMEDMTALCSASTTCPYYVSKAMAKDPRVEVVILPTCECCDSPA